MSIWTIRNNDKKARIHHHLRLLRMLFSCRMRLFRISFCLRIHVSPTVMHRRRNSSGLRESKDRSMNVKIIDFANYLYPYGIPWLSWYRDAVQLTKSVYILTFPSHSFLLYLLLTIPLQLMWHILTNSHPI